MFRIIKIVILPKLISKIRELIFFHILNDKQLKVW